MRSKTGALVALTAALGAAAGVCAYADGGRELLLSGPIEQLDRGTGTVTVLGQKFKAETDQLTVGEVVNVYGQIASDGAITDSLVQGTQKFGTNGDAVFLKGVVTGSDPSLGRLEIDGITIDYTAELGNADFSMPAVGDVVAVAGTQPAAKGVLVVSTAGSAAYAVGIPAGSWSAPSLAMTGGDSKVSGTTGNGSAASMFGMTGSGSAASMFGMTGSGSAAGMTGSGARTAGMTGSGR
jgi:Domain of unknown function (DUF5666)